MFISYFLFFLIPLSSLTLDHLIHNGKSWIMLPILTPSWPHFLDSVIWDICHLTPCISTPTQSPGVWELEKHFWFIPCFTWSSLWSNSDLTQKLVNFSWFFFCMVCIHYGENKKEFLITVECYFYGIQHFMCIYNVLLEHSSCGLNCASPKYIEVLISST